MTVGSLVVGVGNPDRGDDAVGLHVARRIAASAVPGVSVIEVTGDALALLDRWSGAERVVLVDAAAPISTPGTVHCLDPIAVPLPREIALGSSHAFGLAEAVELARTLGTLPARMTIYAIEASHFTAGAPLTPAVAEAAARVAARIAADLASSRAGTADA
jgi:hydrogenase maturation protease